MGNPEAKGSRLGRIVTTAWVLAPVVVGAFVWLHSQPGVVPLALSQLLFLVPIALAALAAERAYAVGKPGIERRAWGLLSITVAVLLLSEGYYSWYQVFISAAGPKSPSVFDALNVVAALMIALGIAQLAGVGRLPRAGWLRFVFDGVAFSAVTFAAIYHFMVRPLAGGIVRWESARWTAYSLVGVLVLVGAVWLVANTRPGGERHLVGLVSLALGIFASGMLLWPMWRAGASAGGNGVLDALVAAVYLLGYYVLMMAGFTRLRDKDQAWRLANSRMVSTEGVWASTLLSLYVLAGVGLMGMWVYRALGIGGEVEIYLFCGIVATLGLVARTGVTAIETVIARSEADVDAVTGVLGGGTFLRHVEAAISRADRRGESVSLIVFDVDGFSRGNALLGRAGGDAVLRDIATVTSKVAAGRGELFRVSADEFSIVCPLAEANAVVLATEVLGAIRGLSPVGDLRLSASVGVVGRDSTGCTRDELVRRADAARAWAKYHGKGQVVRFDPRIVRALGVEERLREHDDRTGIELARALVSAADARDPRNYYHARNVAALAVILSEALGLGHDHVRRIELAAMLHDVGKLGLIDSLLADVLRTARQQMAAREHAAFGEMLVTSVGVPGLAQWVRHHHERWDGAGYPDGLSGEGVPLESRIIALADAYDAMTSSARSRRPMSRGAALQEIDLGMGSRFDPAIAEKFIEVVGVTASLGWSDEWMIA